MTAAAMSPPSDAVRVVTLECLRFDPESDAEPHWQRYDVPCRDDWSVLQALQHIKDHLDGSLTFRWSCRMAICGSCGMMIDGVPRLACHAFLRDFGPGPLRIEPLQHFPILRDLAIDQNGFLDKLEAVKPWLIPKAERPLSAGPHRQTPQQMDAYYAYSQCINCQLCYAACPQVGLDEAFLGPAALALLHRYNADSRDQGWAARADIVNADAGVWGCTLVGYCSEVCPKAVDPAHAINQNKVNSTLDYAGLRRLLQPKGRTNEAAATPCADATRVLRVRGRPMSRYRGPARGHVRPMAGWWRRNPFFVRYMLREASAVVLLAYALVLLTGLAALVHGDAAFDTWRAGLATPLSLLLHALGLPLLGYHSWTWFQVMPKTLPRLPVPARAVTLGALLLAAALSAVILVLVAGAGR